MFDQEFIWTKQTNKAQCSSIYSATCNRQEGKKTYNSLSLKSDGLAPTNASQTICAIILTDIKS